LLKLLAALIKGKDKIMKTRFFWLILAVFAILGFNQAQAAEKTYTNSIGMEFVLSPAGEFMMGAGANDIGAKDDEKPQHKVTISKDFYLGKCEVTQEQWTKVMGSNPSNFKGRTNPVEQVSWDDVQEFIRRLNQKEGHKRYRLPTEAEWEYAARAGSTTIYSFGDDDGQLGDYAWYEDNADDTHPVGKKKPNFFGLYDMHGNVYEWVHDWYSENYYSESPSSDPTGPTSGSDRVLRGGSWRNLARGARSASRYSSLPGSRGNLLGFRLALSPGK
jgi:formylglycine-generating enzyme required for sulfatase activity